MRVHSARRQETDHLAEECGVVLQQADRQPSGADDFLPVVNVLQECVNRAHPLFDTARDLAPFARRYDPRDDVEGDQAFLGLVITIDGECYPGPPEELFGLTRLAAQLFTVLIAEPLMIGSISCARGTILFQHFVEAGRFGGHWSQGCTNSWQITSTFAPAQYLSIPRA